MSPHVEWWFTTVFIGLFALIGVWLILLSLFGYIHDGFARMPGLLRRGGDPQRRWWYR